MSAYADRLASPVEGFLGAVDDRLLRILCPHNAHVSALPDPCVRVHLYPREGGDYV